VESEANHDKNTQDHLMKHRPKPSCRKRLPAANVDRRVALGEDEAAGVRKLTPAYAGREGLKQNQATLAIIRHNAQKTIACVGILIQLTLFEIIGKFQDGSIRVIQRTNQENRIPFKRGVFFS
jgi:hypothetical protein